MGASGSVKVGFQMRIYDFGPGVEHLPVVTSMAQDALQKPQGTLKNHKTRNWSNYPRTVDSGPAVLHMGTWVAPTLLALQWPNRMRAFENAFDLAAAPP